jgi:hypothetical protein
MLADRKIIHPGPRQKIETGKWKLEKGQEKGPTFIP